VVDGVVGAAVIRGVVAGIRGVPPSTGGATADDELGTAWACSCEEPGRSGRFRRFTLARAVVTGVSGLPSSENTEQRGVDVEGPQPVRGVIRGVVAAGIRGVVAGIRGVVTDGISKGGGVRDRAAAGRSGPTAVAAISSRPSACLRRSGCFRSGAVPGLACGRNWLCCAASKSAADAVNVLSSRCLAASLTCCGVRGRCEGALPGRAPDISAPAGALPGRAPDISTSASFSAMKASTC
jgi:hypothetical protein